MCFVLQPEMPADSGEVYEWHIPVTAHVLITLVGATRLSGVSYEWHISVRSCLSGKRSYVNKNVQSATVIYWF